MDINELTIGQLREISDLLNPVRPAPVEENHPLIGEYVIVRCTNAGVHAGKLEKIYGRTAILSESRRLWRWKAKREAFLSGVARYGIGDGSVIGGDVFITLTETCEIIRCSEEAEQSIRKYPVHNPE